MAENRRPGKLAVILHADIAGSTKMVQQDEHIAHERILDTFRRFSRTIEKYQGNVRELRGDALLAVFERASDAVCAATIFQIEQSEYSAKLDDDIRPTVRVGIAIGEVIVADNTVTGAGVILAPMTRLSIYQKYFRIQKLAALGQSRQNLGPGKGPLIAQTGQF